MKKRYILFCYNYPFRFHDKKIMNTPPKLGSITIYSEMF